MEQVQGAMELDRCGLDRIEAARKDVRERIVEGKRTAVLNDHAFAFAQGLAGFTAQDFHGELAHHVAQ